MPPIIGTAMRCITSEPVPSFHRMGSRPHALDRAFHDRSMKVGAREGAAHCRTAGAPCRNRSRDLSIRFARPLIAWQARTPVQWAHRLPIRRAQ